MVTIALVWNARELAGTVASLGCLLIAILALTMLAEYDRPRQDRGFDQAENARGIFDERPAGKHTPDSRR